MATRYEIVVRSDDGRHLASAIYHAPVDVAAVGDSVALGDHKISVLSREFVYTKDEEILVVNLIGRTIEAREPKAGVGGAWIP
ncbi:hypothetical protein [Paludisphaera mucosa]|uniref:Uncharacterized protein n=1 Tax=Paludisphaera mucosa TaxID=3030827 RepID=A0ABT6FLN6_9BACT|nr:hypothetical protein [Paludisphaera mucosa]MDG3008496.1 hypothetical protein [Paludisphaera mucosa]